MFFIICLIMDCLFSVCDWTLFCYRLTLNQGVFYAYFRVRDGFSDFSGPSLSPVGEVWCLGMNYNNSVVIADYLPFIIKQRNFFSPSFKIIHQGII